MLAKDLKLQGQSPLPGNWKLIRNGKTIYEVTGRKMEVTISEPGNYRAEVWLKMREWLRAGSIPADATLMAELCAPEFSEGPAGILIERKKDMRARGLNSPDSADALSLTFSYPTFTQASGLVGQSDYRVAHEYDPFSDAALEGKPLPESRRRYTVPGYPLKPEWGGGLDNPADWANPDAGPGEWQ